MNCPKRLYRRSLTARPVPLIFRANRDNRRVAWRPVNKWLSEAELEDERFRLGDHLDYLPTDEEWDAICHFIRLWTVRHDWEEHDAHMAFSFALETFIRLTIQRNGKLFPHLEGSEVRKEMPEYFRLTYLRGQTRNEVSKPECSGFSDPPSSTTSAPFSSDLIRAIHAQYRLDWNGIHGASHWARVMENGLLLATATGAREDVVVLFALFHDACRENDGQDPGHGARGSELACEFRAVHYNIDDSGWELLREACAGHTGGRPPGDISILTCWDADRLDLPRIGTWIKRHFLCTEPARAKEMVDWAVKRSKAGVFPWAEAFV